MTVEAGKTDKCPHCGVPNRFEKVANRNGFHQDRLYLRDGDPGELEELNFCRCTACGRIIIFWRDQMIFPLGRSRPPCPKEVPNLIAEDYVEACLVELLSKKSAAALARRCLQNVLHEQGIKKRDLNEEIDEVIPKLPSYLSEAVDAIRTIGNFATHPIKYKNTSKIVDVEEGEAEWVLDVLEQLFDFYYVSPSILKIKKAELNEKLKAVGKPPLK